MKRFVKDSGLTIALTAMFLLSLFVMVLTGRASFNQELTQHGARPIGLLAYLVTGEFWSALFENWESEFLQMSIYVILTAILFQRGSSESRDPDSPDRPNDEIPSKLRHRHPLLAWLYAYSLGLALALLFLISIALHWWGSFKAANADGVLHGGSPQSAASYLFDAQVWFESFQNWQSEFLSTAVLVVLSIFLRHKGSPESKPISASNSDTGSS